MAPKSKYFADQLSILLNAYVVYERPSIIVWKWGKNTVKKYSCIKKISTSCVLVGYVGVQIVIRVNIYISDFSHVTLLGESTYLQKQVCTAFDKATSAYTLFFILGKKACCLDREKSQNPLMKCKICRRSDILNFSYTFISLSFLKQIL